VALAGAQGKRVFGNVEAWLVPSDVTNQLYHADMQNNVLFIFVPHMMYRNQRLTVTFSILSCLAHERKPRFLSAGNQDFRWPHFPETTTMGLCYTSGLLSLCAKLLEKEVCEFLVDIV
jgi:hypothetical protein